MKLRYILPLALFLAVVVLLFVGLGLNPRQIPSARVGTAAPDFELPLLYGEGVLKTKDLKDGQMKLLNIFGSWCVPCMVEHPYLMELSRQGIPVYAIDHLDTEEGAKQFFARLGNPYQAIGFDPEGRVGIDFGMSGVPETYVINGDGQILYQHIGPLDTDVIDGVIMPLLNGRGP